MKLDRILKWIPWLLRLNIIPGGWLTYIAGFAAFALGFACVTGADAVAGVHLPCPKDPTTLMLGGATVIGLRRFAERFVPKA